MVMSAKKLEKLEEVILNKGLPTSLASFAGGFGLMAYGICAQKPTLEAIGASMFGAGLIAMFHLPLIYYDVQDTRKQREKEYS